MIIAAIALTSMELNFDHYLAITSFKPNILVRSIPKESSIRFQNLSNQQIKVQFATGSLRLDLYDNKGKEVQSTELGKQEHALFRFADKVSLVPIGAKESFLRPYYPLNKLFDLAPGDYKLFITYEGGIKVGKKSFYAERKYGPFKINVK